MVSDISIRLPEEVLAENLMIVDLDHYPKHVRDVSVEEAMNFMDLFKAQVQWAARQVKKLDGYGIAFPQMGFAINAAVLRFSRLDSPRLFMNLKFEPFKDKGKAPSLEACYSIAFAGIPFTHMRWKKILATWMETDGKVHQKVFRIPKNAKAITPGHIWQHECEHMLDEFPTHIADVLHAPYNARWLPKIKDVIDKVQGGISKVEPIFNLGGRYAPRPE